MALQNFCLPHPPGFGPYPHFKVSWGRLENILDSSCAAYTFGAVQQCLHKQVRVIRDAIVGALLLGFLHP
jgi:hypothetical protein